MKFLRIILFSLYMLAVGCAVPPQVKACTSALVSAAATRDGRPLLWKHRDSGHPHNFVARMEATDSTLAYVALFNAGDTALAEAWIGFNSAGFAVMNTASYNLAPDTAALKDCEGVIMSAALASCRTVPDFIRMLSDRMNGGPLGVQANFGVMDATGDGAYVETSDNCMKVYRLGDSDNGCLVRSNYSYSGGVEGRLGQQRHDNAVVLLDSVVTASCVIAETFTEGLSRSFYHAGEGCDMDMSAHRTLVDRGEYIPRRSSCASVVVEGVRDGENPALKMVMWVAIGFPAASHVEAVMLDDIPEELLPVAPDGHSGLCDEVNGRRSRVFRRKDKSGHWLFDMEYLRPVMDAQSAISRKKYAIGRAARDLR